MKTNQKPDSITTLHSIAHLLDDTPPTLKDHSFASVNEFVHHPNVHFEQLQGALLSIAAELEREKSR